MFLAFDNHSRLLPVVGRMHSNLYSWVCLKGRGRLELLICRRKLANLWNEPSCRNRNFLLIQSTPEDSNPC